MVAYQATWQESASSAGNAAIFLNGNQLQIPAASGPIVTAATCSGVASNGVLQTTPGGLVGLSASSYSGDVTTGQVISNTNVQPAGGPCWIFAAAGTYTVSVQFKASSGSVAASNRKLWVQAVSFS